MDPFLALGAAGSLFSLVGLLGRVQAYIERVEETREVKDRLRIVLYPLVDYRNYFDASNESGNALRAKVRSLSLPVKTSELEDLLRGMMEFIDDFTKVLSSILGFAKQSNILISDLQTFMQKVERTMPEIHETILFFGKHYDPKLGSLDLAHLPTFFAVHGLKLEPKRKKQKEELTKSVAEGGRLVDKAIQAAKSIGQRSLNIRDRHLKKEFPSSYKALFKEIGKLKATTDVAKELSHNAPLWLVDLAKILERVQKVLPELSKPIYRSPKVPGIKTAHRK